jgi:hypothetical protein
MALVAGWIVVGLLTPGPVRGMPPAEAELVAAVESLYRDAPAGPAAPTAAPGAAPQAPARLAGAFGRAGRCGSALLFDVHARWDSLSGEARARLGPLLEPPGKAPDGTPAAPDGYSTVETAHFRVHYRPSGPDAPPRTDANANGVPDFVDSACGYLEQAYARQVQEMGFSPPPDARETVYFRKLNHNGLTHPMPGRRSWLELNSDILGYTKRALGAYFDPAQVSRDPAGVEAGLVKAVCAHEFFHAIQAMYSWNQPKWWMEGTADWMGNQVFPESGFYLNNVGPHLQQPHVSLFAEGDFFEYSASLFPTFLTEHAGGAGLIRTVWESCRSAPLSQALEAATGDLPETFMLHACYNMLRNYKDGSRMPEPDVRTIDEHPASFSPESGRAPQYYGANFIRLKPRRPGRLVVRMQPQDRSDVRAKVIAVDGEAGTWTILNSRPAADRSVTVAVDGFGGRIRQVNVVVGAFSPNAKGRYTLTTEVR